MSDVARDEDRRGAMTEFTEKNTIKAMVVIPAVKVLNEYRRIFDDRIVISGTKRDDYLLLRRRG
jgi:hypothetical protein